MQNASSKRLYGQVMSIVGENSELHRMEWLNHRAARNEYITKLAVDGVRGKKYSGAVVKWDRENKLGWCK